MKPFPVSLLLSTFLLTGSHAMAGIYRWVDDQGQVVYSQTPPPGDREVSELAPPPPPAEAPDAALERIRSQTRKLEKASQERREEKAEKDKRKQEEKIRKKNCETARRNLETLKSRPPNTLYRTGEGEYRRFTIDELNQQIAEQEKLIRENCK
jgi:hypothetical protein